jgi:ornithine cyclodeaminase
MIILKAEDVIKALPMDKTIDAMKSAFKALSNDTAVVPLRAHLDIAPYEGTSLFMPSFVQDEEGDSLALKAVSVYPLNVKKEMPIIHAAVLVLEAQTGRIQALIEGSTLTAIRTGAASGAATDILARPESSTAAIFGAGVQGRTQLEAICTVRKIKTAWVYDLDLDKSQDLVDEMRGRGEVPWDLKVAIDPNEITCKADVICTATTSKTPIYDAKTIQPGTHINGVGSYTLEMIENPPKLLGNAITFVDSFDAVLAEAGEIIEAINRNFLSPSKITELGDVILGNSTGRNTSDQITFFKSVGIAVQDALAARLALQNAQEMGIGQRITW